LKPSVSVNARRHEDSARSVATPEIICGGEGEIDMNNSVPMSNNLLKFPVPQWHAHNGGPYYQSNAGKTEGHRKSPEIFK
jgi:hypothetical protein